MMLYDLCYNQPKVNVSSITDSKDCGHAIMTPVVVLKEILGLLFSLCVEVFNSEISLILTNSRLGKSILWNPPF